VSINGELTLKINLTMSRKKSDYVSAVRGEVQSPASEVKEAANPGDSTGQLSTPTIIHSLHQN
jgi:hypothetical protein